MATAETSSRRALLGVAYAAIAACVVAISPASAGGTAGISCPGTVEHPFLRWVDPAAYTLAPGGDFEGKATGWQLSGGAKLVTGNEPFKVHRPTDARSLALPAGASALSLGFCAGLGEPTLRFFAVGGNLLSTLKVEAVYTTALGKTTQLVTLVPAKGAWGPTLQTPMLANLVGLTSLDGLTTTVQLRFTSLGTAGWKIDDVYVDPWKVT